MDKAMENGLSILKNTSGAPQDTDAAWSPRPLWTIFGHHRSSI